MYANEAGMNACQVNCSCRGMVGAVRPHSSSFSLLDGQAASMVALAVHLLVYGCWPAQALNTVYKEAAASHRSTDVSNTTGACIATTAT